MTRRSTIFISLLALVIFFILYYLTSSGRMGDNPVGQTGSYNSPLIVPAGYAFSIWGLIYTGLIAFPLFQLFKKTEKLKEWNQVRFWYTLNIIGNGLWLVFASYNWLWTTVIIIAFMLFTLYKINELLIEIRTKGGKVNFWAERLVFSLYFAWITLATALNISAALHFYQWDGLGISDLTWALIILPIVAVVAGIVFWKYRDAGYASVVVWAFIALVVRHFTELPVLAYLSIAVAVVFLGLIFIKGQKFASV